MPDEDQNATDPQDQTNSQQDEEQAPQTEQPAEQEPQVEAEEPKETEAEGKTEEDIDMEKYWQERYQSSPQSEAPVEDLTKELAGLPTDEYGTVDAQAAADWFSGKLEETRTQARHEAASQGTQAAMAVFSETAQQQQLLKEYPEVSKDRELLDAIFDLRDAATLKGQNISLMDAAQRLDGFRQRAKTEGAQRANKTTEIQAAAHLETSAVKQNAGVPERQRLAQQALHGSGQEAIEARRQMLKTMVEEDIKEGRIIPS